MSIYVVTLRGTLFQQEIINRFSYVGSGVGADSPSALGLAVAFGVVPVGDPPAYPTGTPFDALINTQSVDMSWAEAEVRNLYDPTDFYTAAFSPAVVGVVGESASSPTLAYGLSSNRVRTDIRGGQKRVAGVVESALGVGGAITGDLVALLDTLADSLGEVLTFATSPNEADFHPAVLSYEMYTEPPERKAYRPYASEVLQLEHAALDVLWAKKPFVRTQVSRQYGHGA